MVSADLPGTQGASAEPSDDCPARRDPGYQLAIGTVQERYPFRNP